MSLTRDRDVDSGRPTRHLASFDAPSFFEALVEKATLRDVGRRETKSSLEYLAYRSTDVTRHERRDRLPEAAGKTGSRWHAAVAEEHVESLLDICLELALRLLIAV